MNNTLKLILLFFLAMAWSCAPVYVPSTHSAPMLEKKDDVHTSIYTGTNGINAQFAYAATEDIGVQVNGLYLKEEEEEDDKNRVRKSMYGEIAFGKYGKLNNYFRVESYLGAGHGWSRAWNGFSFLNYNDETYVKGHFNKYFAFSNIAFTTSAIDAGIGMKLSYVDFYKLVNEEMDVDFGGTRAAYFAEPVVFTRIGFGLIKYEIMMGMTQPIGKKPKFGYDPLFISVGIHLNWGAGKNK